MALIWSYAKGKSKTVQIIATVACILIFIVGAVLKEEYRAYTREKRLEEIRIMEEYRLQ